jgi:hypothetical protein
LLIENRTECIVVLQFNNHQSKINNCISNTTACVLRSLAASAPSGRG